MSYYTDQLSHLNYARFTRPPTTTLTNKTSTHMPKQFSPASERNKAPILNVLRRLFSESNRILEIGSGTGQHAVWFSHHLPQITWQPSDRANAFQDLSDSLPTEVPSNLLQPIRLDVAQNDVSEFGKFDAVYTANTLHIMLSLIHI